MKTHGNSGKARGKRPIAKKIAETYRSVGFVYCGAPYTTAQEFGNRFKRLTIYKESELITTATSGV